MTLDNERTSGKIWSSSDTLSDRVKRLRDQFYSFHDRTETNEPYSFSTGTRWDEVYSTHDWAQEPALYPFFASINATLQAMAIPVILPDGYWDHGLAMRRAFFFNEVMTKYMPVTILDDELIVGFNFNTALSKSMNKSETKARNKEMSKWFKEAGRLFLDMSFQTTRKP